jgi:hypothetical protein
MSVDAVLDGPLDGPGSPEEGATPLPTPDMGAG